MTANSLPAARCISAPGSRSLAPVSVAYLVYREATGAVFPSQVLAPLAKHQDDVRLRLGVFAPVGQFLRSGARGKLKHVRELAGQQFGLTMDLLMSPPTRAPWLWRDATTLRKWLRRHYPANKSFVMHCRGAAMTNLALDVRPLFPQAKIIFDCRGAEPAEILHRAGLDESTADRWPAGIRAEYDQSCAREQRAVRDGDHVFCVSQAMVDYLGEKCDGLRDKSAVIPCCPDVENFHDAPAWREAMRAQLRLTDRLVVAYCGSLERYQLPDQCVRLFKIIAGLRDDAHFLAITTHPARMQQVVDSAGLPASSYTIVSCAASDVPRYLSAADVGLMLRDQSTVNRVASPLKLGEYLAAGLPVIVTPGLGDYSRLVETHSLGRIIDLASADAHIAVELQPLFGQLRDSDCAARCRQVAREQLSWESFLDVREKVYRKLLYA